MEGALTMPNWIQGETHVELRWNSDRTQVNKWEATCAMKHNLLIYKSCFASYLLWKREKACKLLLQALVQKSLKYIFLALFKMHAF